MPDINLIWYLFDKPDFFKLDNYVYILLCMYEVTLFHLGQTMEP